MQLNPAGMWGSLYQSTHESRNVSFKHQKMLSFLNEFPSIFIWCPLISKLTSVATHTHTLLTQYPRPSHVKWMCIDSKTWSISSGSETIRNTPSLFSYWENIYMYKRGEVFGLFFYTFGLHCMIKVEWRVLFCRQEKRVLFVSLRTWHTGAYFASYVCTSLFVYVYIYDCQECRYNRELTHGWNSFPTSLFTFFRSSSFQRIDISFLSETLEKKKSLSWHLAKSRSHCRLVTLDSFICLISLLFIFLLRDTGNQLIQHWSAKYPTLFPYLNVLFFSLAALNLTLMRQIDKYANYWFWKQHNNISVSNHFHIFRAVRVLVYCSECKNATLFGGIQRSFGSFFFSVIPFITPQRIRLYQWRASPPPHTHTRMVTKTRTSSLYLDRPRRWEASIVFVWRMLSNTKRCSQTHVLYKVRRRLFFFVVR